MKKFIVMILSLMFFCFMASGAWAATTPVLYVNNSKAAVKPIIVNQSAMLPLRDTFNLFGCDDINWDNKTATVTAITGDLTLTMKVGDAVAWSKLGNEEGMEEELEQAPVLKNNRVYLPLRFVAETFHANITYDKGRIDIHTPFKYAGGKWYFDTGAYFNYKHEFGKWEAISENKLTAGQQNTVSYCVLPITDPDGAILYTHSYLYALDKQGKAKLLFHFPYEIEDYKILDDTVYYQTSVSMWGASYIIGKAKLTGTITNVTLGQDNFFYGTKLTLSPQLPAEHYYISGRSTGNWEVKPEGVYAVGYQQEGIIENTVGDYDVLKQTYGYYLLDKDGKGHTMVEKLDFEYK